MSSELERLDADVRAFARAGLTDAGMVDSARNSVSGLTQQVANMRVEGVDLSPVLRALAEAETRLSSAAALVRSASARATGYAASHLGGGSSADALPATTVAAPAPSALDTTLAGRGLKMALVSDFDFADNPITSWDKAPREEIEWAVSRWNDTLAPGIAGGKSREDFEAMDAASGAGDHRRLANVWDYFLGDDAIHSGGTTPSGGLDVGGGRHRLQVARELGITFLPVRFH